MYLMPSLMAGLLSQDDDVIPGRGLKVEERALEQAPHIVLSLKLRTLCQNT